MLRTKQLAHFHPDDDEMDPEAEDAASDAASRHNLLAPESVAPATSPADTESLAESPSDDDTSPNSIRTYQSTKDRRSRRPRD
ncbi:MAG: hypothetical protein ACK56F_13435, partial [bacterium]